MVADTIIDSEPFEPVTSELIDTTGLSESEVRRIPSLLSMFSEEVGDLEDGRCEDFSPDDDDDDSSPSSPFAGSSPSSSPSKYGKIFFSSESQKNMSLWAVAAAKAAAMRRGGGRNNRCLGSVNEAEGGAPDGGDGDDDDDDDDGESADKATPGRPGFCFSRARSLMRLGIKKVKAGTYADFDSDAEEEGAADSSERPQDDDNSSPSPSSTGPLLEEYATEPAKSSTKKHGREHGHKHKLLRTSSFAKSMSEYAFRREMIKLDIAEGGLTSHMSPTGRHGKDIRNQVNLEFYTDYNQARRRHIKKHPQFIAIAKRLW